MLSKKVKAQFSLCDVVCYGAVRFSLPEMNDSSVTLIRFSLRIFCCVMSTPLNLSGDLIYTCHNFFHRSSTLPGKGKEADIFLQTLDKIAYNGQEEMLDKNVVRRYIHVSGFTLVLLCLNFLCMMSIRILLACFLNCIQYQTGITGFPINKPLSKASK